VTSSISVRHGDISLKQFARCLLRLNLIGWSSNEFLSTPSYKCYRRALCHRRKRHSESKSTVIRIKQTTGAGQGGRTGAAIAAAKTQKKNAPSAALARKPTYAAAKSIRKSSICFPDLSCAASQRGFFPRPAQVSDGSAGFRYFGKTCG
jgi:hypothetical protein